MLSNRRRPAAGQEAAPSALPTAADTSAGCLSRRNCLAAVRGLGAAWLAGCAGPEAPPPALSPAEEAPHRPASCRTAPRRRRTAGCRAAAPLLRPPRLPPRMGRAPRPGRSAGRRRAARRRSRHGSRTVPRRAAAAGGKLPPAHRDLLISHAVLSYAQALAKGAVPPAAATSVWPSPRTRGCGGGAGCGAGGGRPGGGDRGAGPAHSGLCGAARGPAQPARARARRPRRRRQPTADRRQSRAPALAAAAVAARASLGGHHRTVSRSPPRRPAAVPHPCRRRRGGERKQSPELHTRIEGAFFNPPWIIPADIVAASILPRIVQDPEFLTRNNILLHPNGEAEQAPGAAWRAGGGNVRHAQPFRRLSARHAGPQHLQPRQPARQQRLHPGGEPAAADGAADAAAACGHREAGGGGPHRARRTARAGSGLPRLSHGGGGAGRQTAAAPDFYGRDEPLWRALHKHLPEDPPTPPTAARRGRQGR